MESSILVTPRIISRGRTQWLQPIATVINIWESMRISCKCYRCILGWINNYRVYYWYTLVAYANHVSRYLSLVCINVHITTMSFPALFMQGKNNVCKKFSDAFFSLMVQSWNMTISVHFVLQILNKIYKVPHWILCRLQNQTRLKRIESKIANNVPKTSIKLQKCLLNLGKLHVHI